MAPASFPVPIILLVFNRHGLTEQVFARIRAVRPAQLFVVADGPRPARPGEAERCARVRELVERGVDWPCSLVRDYSEVNLGCAQRVSSGITNAFRSGEEAIVLEDDCLPDPSFFPFCAELLARYRDDSRVGQIGGTTFRRRPPASGDSYYWSLYPHCWGWATWRRAWRFYDHGMVDWAAALRRRRAAGDLPSQAEHSYWESMFSGTAAGAIDSWAYRWTAALWSHDCLSVLPAVSLVRNIGFAPDATHTTHGTAPVSGSLDFPLRHPAAVVRDSVADAETGRRVFQLPTLANRVVRRLRALFN